MSATGRLSSTAALTAQTRNAIAAKSSQALPDNLYSVMVSSSNDHMLVTRPNATGFAPVEKTIGMTNLVSMKGLEHLPNLRHVTSMHVHAEERRRQEERERLQIERDFEKLRREQTGRGGLLNFVRYFWHSLEKLGVVSPRDASRQPR